MSRQAASGRDETGHVESTPRRGNGNDDGEEDSTGYGPTLGHPKFQAVHYYHNASFSSSQASCMTPTATTVMWIPSISDNDDDDDASDAAKEGHGGLVPPSPQKKKKNHRRISLSMDAMGKVCASSGSYFVLQRLWHYVRGSHVSIEHALHCRMLAWCVSSVYADELSAPGHIGSEYGFL
jgi:hypothetical protein